MTIEELNQIVAANAQAQSINTLAISELGKSMTQLTNAMLSLHQSVKSLEATAEVLLESVKGHDTQIAAIIRQWQAYVNTLPKS